MKTTRKNINPALIQTLDGKNQAGTRAVSFGNPIADLALTLASGWEPLKIQSVRNATPVDVKLAIAERKALLKEWDREGSVIVGKAENGDKVEIDYRKIHATALALWTKADGSFIQPEYIGITANRRSHALPAALAIRTETTPYLIPCSISTDPTSEEVWSIRMAENNDLGRSAYDKSELVALASQLCKRGLSETKIGQIIGIDPRKNGFRTAVVQWAEVSNRNPGLNLIDRAQMPQPVDADQKRIMIYEDAGWYPLIKISNTVARWANGGKCIKANEQMSRKIFGDVIGGIPFSEGQTEKLVEYLCSEQGNATKAADNDSQRKISEGANAGLLTAFVNAAATTNSDAMVAAADAIAAAESAQEKLTTLRAAISTQPAKVVKAIYATYDEAMKPAAASPAAASPAAASVE